MFLVFQFHT